MLFSLLLSANCRNDGPHSGECKIHGKEGVGGSSPPEGSFELKHRLQVGGFCCLLDTVEHLPDTEVLDVVAAAAAVKFAGKDGNRCGVVRRPLRLRDRFWG